jgi:hypothetical protein
LRKTPPVTIIEMIFLEEGQDVTRPVGGIKTVETKVRNLNSPVQGEE